MTEYSASSEVIRNFRSTQERTAFWVDQYNQHGTDHLLLSPSLPPSDLSDADIQSGGSSESDAYSTHSIPPRMVLQFPDGRPDMPVSHGYQRPVRSRPRVPLPYNQHPAVIQPPPSSRHSRSRAGSHPLPLGSAHANHPRTAQTLSYVTLPPGQAETPRPPVTPPRSPESIVILPSTDSDQSKHIVSRAITPPLGNGSHSRTPTAHHTSHTPRPLGGGGASQNYAEYSNSPIISPSPRHAYPSSQHHTLPRNHSPGMMFSQSQPLPLSTSGGARYLEQQATAQAYPESKLAYNYSPPAIIYAPSKRTRPQYAPPQIVYSPPMGTRGMSSRHPAPNMVHSQSVPVNQTGVYPPLGSISSKQQSHHSKSHSHSSSHPHDSEGSHTRSLSRGRTRDMIPADQPVSHVRSRSRRSDTRHHPQSPLREIGEDSDDDDGGSVTSNGTYYILPTPGQKVQIIVGYLFIILHEEFC
ncbi:hypothetical protein QCA50_011339 [Cerrena zonata]|uniref:Uncharacterized protein n=1 Tax=Cerrena zonata TaxID=2478898 RepID=A0AAW0G2Y8_9APHY